MKKTLSIKYFIFLSTILVLLPAFVSSASISIEARSKEIYVGDTIVLNVVMDTEKAMINLVEGSLKIEVKEGVASISDLVISGSPLSLWPVKPTLSKEGNSITFVGGTPNGFNSKEAILFKIVLVAKKPGKVTMGPFGFKAYINDGKGTLANVESRFVDISILEPVKNYKPINDWSEVVLDDTTPPEPFTISIGSDSSVFDNQTFITFNAVDTGSGMDYYEVKEGSLEKIRSSNTYVLREQGKEQKIVVSAYDKAGNVRMVDFNSKKDSKEFIVMFIFALAIFTGVFFTVRMMVNNLNKNK